MDGWRVQAPLEAVEPLAVQGWYPDPINHSFLRWWSGSAWTEHVAVRLPSPVPVVEVKPRWRWLLYALALLLGSLITIIVGVVLWCNPKYRGVGRTTTYLSLVLPVGVLLSFVLLAVFD